MPYRVKRDLPENSFVQLKSAPLAECKALLASLEQKWNDVKENGVAFGEEAFVVERSPQSLVVTRGNEVVDRYVIEKVK